MSEEGSITVLVKKEVAFVLMQTFLFVYILPLSGWIYQGNEYSLDEIDAVFAFSVDVIQS